jgi:hypothetical protein
VDEWCSNGLTGNDIMVQWWSSVIGDEDEILFIILLLVFIPLAPALSVPCPHARGEGGKQRSSLMNCSGDIILCTTRPHDIAFHDVELLRDPSDPNDETGLTQAMRGLADIDLDDDGHDGGDELDYNPFYSHG